MTSGPIDLHTHSSVSDGTETPGDLVRSAAALGLSAVALTDHDSTAGWQEAREAVAGTGMTLVPGMELSTRVGMYSVHMLGYLFDPADEALVTMTDRLRHDRSVRAERMVERIGVDYDLTWDDVLAQATVGATLGRPHIADALVAKGYAVDRSAAFAGILHWRSGYYEPHEAPSPLTGVRLIRTPAVSPSWRTRPRGAARPTCRGRTSSSSSRRGSAASRSITARTPRVAGRPCARSRRSTTSSSPAPATTTARASPTAWRRTAPLPISWSASSRRPSAAGPSRADASPVRACA